MTPEEEALSAIGEARKASKPDRIREAVSSARTANPPVPVARIEELTGIKLSSLYRDYGLRQERS